MAKKYMPKDVFEVGVCSIAKVHLGTNKTLEEVANAVWRHYSDSIIDDGVVTDMVRAVRESVSDQKGQTRLNFHFNRV